MDRKVSDLSVSTAMEPAEGVFDERDWLVQVFGKYHLVPSHPRGPGGKKGASASGGAQKARLTRIRGQRCAARALDMDSYWHLGKSSN